MSGDIRYENDASHTFIFHGKGLNYFLISLVNVLLSIITLGIYIPWAMVRSRRYVYENLELNGARFGYHAKGGALFLSWFVLLVFYVGVIIINQSQPLVAMLVMLFLMIVTPFLLVKSLQYNALMTTLNNVRFSFHCPMKSVWWVMMGLPLLLLCLVAVVLFAIFKIMFFDLSSGDMISPDGIIVKIAVLIILGVVGMGITNGYVYAKWLKLMGKGGQYGMHKFDINVSTQQCIKIGLFSLAILVPFILLIMYFLAPIFSSMVMPEMMGEADEMAQFALLSQFQKQILACYLLYFAAILLSSAYIWQAYRNHFMNGLTLADGRIRFSSTLTLPGVVLQIFLLAVVSMVTCGIAYPWMKMRFIRYQAAHSHLAGQLDGIDLADHDEKVDRGVIAVLSRGLMPIVPFI